MDICKCWPSPLQYLWDCNTGDWIDVQHPKDAARNMQCYVYVLRMGRYGFGQKRPEMCRCIPGSCFKKSWQSIAKKKLINYHMQLCCIFRNIQKFNQISSKPCRKSIKHTNTPCAQHCHRLPKITVGATSYLSSCHPSYTPWYACTVQRPFGCWLQRKGAKSEEHKEMKKTMKRVPAVLIQQSSSKNDIEGPDDYDLYGISFLVSATLTASCGGLRLVARALWIKLTFQNGTKYQKSSKI